MFFFLYIFSNGQIFSNYIIDEIEPAKLIVTYSLEYQQDSLFPDYTRQEDMRLMIGDSVSLFVSDLAFIMEKDFRSIITHEQVQEYIDNKPALARFYYRIYKNLPSEYLTFTNRVDPNRLKYTEPLNNIQWELTEETTKIKNYTAQKATCEYGGRKWVAWFTPEIPYSDGPYKFHGLPGLILEMHDTKNHYVFNLISIVKPTDSPMIEYLDKDYIETTKQKYLKAKYTFDTNLDKWARERGAGADVQQKAAKVSKERNNPIEFFDQ